MKNVKSLSIGFMLGVVSCVMVFIGKRIFLPSAREALPFFATFKEERQEDGFIPDFSYKLEAAMTVEQFQWFVRKMRFPESSRVNPRLYIIDKPEHEYQKKAEYVGGTLHFEEFQN